MKSLLLNEEQPKIIKSVIMKLRNEEKKKE